MTAPRLAGRRVLVTRAAEDAGAWAARLTALGAEPVILPCIRTELFHDANTRARLTTALRAADWLCLMSARGVEAVAALTAPFAATFPAALRIAAVGDATAEAVRATFGAEPFVARGGTSRALGEELLAECGTSPAAAAAPTAPVRIVVAAAEGGRTDAEVALARGGAAVTRVDVYRTVPAARSAAPIDLAREHVGDVLLASPSAVQGLLNQVALPAGARIFTLGPTTSAAVAAAGLVVSAEASRPDLDSLLEAMQ